MVNSFFLERLKKFLELLFSGERRDHPPDDLLLSESRLLLNRFSRLLLFSKNTLSELHLLRAPSKEPEYFFSGQTTELACVSTTFLCLARAAGS